MIRFLADENFHGAIVRGLFQRLPELDLIRVQDTPLYGSLDDAILEWSANENRIVLTNDASTMTDFAYQRIQEGKPVAGVFVVAQKTTISAAIDDLVSIAECSLENEWHNQVRFIPLR